MYGGIPLNIGCLPAIVILLFSKTLDDNLLEGIIDSATLDSVGRRAISLYILASDFRPKTF